ncbi:hypothetical protein [Blastomonas aquatica]|uniref:Uncharacterized protein n=1 Tax=Blastomonas aquatica TaxID=1510276 RepID=A0ABQ1IYW1_9SPHN|nr:hypothetical protein [Blastomonas aquatica]GGB55789.1 hypothetical protein GCM10010833_08110 [Blastomonas aquatica]
MRRFVLFMVTPTLLLPVSLRAADPPAEPSNTLENIAETRASEEVRGLRLDNDAKELAAKAARNKAIADAFPASDTSGKTDVKANAGQVEAQGLAAAAINALAGPIARRASDAATWSSAHSDSGAAAIDCSLLTSLAAPVPPPAPAPAQRDANGRIISPPPPPSPAVPMLLLGGAQTLSFGHFDQFRFRACTIAKSISETSSSANQALLEEGGEGLDDRAGSFPGIGAGLSAAVDLMKLITPDWEVGAVEAKLSDRSLMLAVARAYLGLHISRSDDTRPLHWQGATSKLGGSNDVFAALRDLDTLSVTAQSTLNALKPKVAAAQKAFDKIAKTPGAANSAEKAALDKWSGHVTAITAARASYAQLVAQLNGKDGEAVLPINQVVNEAATVKLLGNRGLALTLSVESAAGGYYSRKALWNVFNIGGPPFFVSGGVVVSFAVVRPSDQRVVASGLFSCHSGYVQVNKVAARVNGAEAGNAVGCKPIQ